MGLIAQEVEKVLPNLVQSNFAMHASIGLDCANVSESRSIEGGVDNNYSLCKILLKLNYLKHKKQI